MAAVDLGRTVADFALVEPADDKRTSDVSYAASPYSVETKKYIFYHTGKSAIAINSSNPNIVFTICDLGLTNGDYRDRVQLCGALNETSVLAIVSRQSNTVEAVVYGIEPNNSSDLEHSIARYNLPQITQASLSTIFEDKCRLDVLDSSGYRRWLSLPKSLFLGGETIIDPEPYLSSAAVRPAWIGAIEYDNSLYGVSIDPVPRLHKLELDSFKSLSVGDLPSLKPRGGSVKLAVYQNKIFIPGTDAVWYFDGQNIGNASVDFGMPIPTSSRSIVSMDADSTRIVFGFSTADESGKILESFTI